ncbi:hypothetical protein CPB84DRAFT_1846207 [Gymnopilus junonius]|uniref:DUF7587 domain-containing protein n=1 Tax=Gymnopilus junonius TaxID=109634 RepID=A0A9P5TNB9_GYMJU|nr:hypothetical protein CPB84DRAFT_1846207 [Gymnopilus junonius]
MYHLDSEIGSLPQCGFGADINFDTLIKDNRFLFRVYTPKERSPFEDDTEPFFVASRFDEQVARSPIDLPKVRFSEAAIGSYAEVARHMDWTTRSSSSYISTSFSFSWSIWEALRRYHQGVKKDVEIAVIDATALGGRAATAVQLLQKSSLAERTEQFWKWHRFSQDSQSVLVYGMIPRTAVLASIPLLQILRKMPSYFLRSDIQTIYGNPLDQVVWNYRLRKQSYRQFCRDMSNSFLNRPTEVQVRDSTAGSVRLALAFLRPFFHQAVQDDFEMAISYLRNLAITISEWPRGSWAVNHPEIRRIIETMVLSLAEELQEQYSVERQEVTRLQLVVDGLEQTLKLHNNATTSLYVVEEDEEDVDDGELDLHDDDPTLVVDEVEPALHKLIEVQSSPLSPAAFRPPITPPESRRNSLLMETTAFASKNTVSTPVASIPVSEDGPESTNKSFNISPLSESPVSPPLTPPSCSPIFQVSILPVYEAMDMGPVQTTTIDSPEHAMDNLGGESVVEGFADDRQFSAALESEEVHEDDEDRIIPSDKLEEFPTVADEGDEYETEHEDDMDHEVCVSPSPTDPWFRVRPHLSSFSSQSSIGSIETLCEPVEFPSKRLSLVSTDSYEFIPPFSSFRPFGLASRTASFSEPSPKLPLSPVVDAVDPLDIPLPPSPEMSYSSLSESSSLSRSSSSDSSSSAASALLETADVPLKPSPPETPILPLESSSSQSSQTPLSTSSPTPAIPLELPLPVEASALLVLPKHHISLLSPLTESNETEDDDTSSLRSVSFTDNASYLVTGFLVGAFITLFFFSTRRRELLVLT